MLKQDYDKLIKDRLKRRAYKRARRIRIYSFLYRKKYKIILFLILLFVLLFPTTTALLIGKWFNAFITTFINYI